MIQIKGRFWERKYNSIGAHMDFKAGSLADGMREVKRVAINNQADVCVVEAEGKKYYLRPVAPGGEWYVPGVDSRCHKKTLVKWNKGE